MTPSLATAAPSRNGTQPQGRGAGRRALTDGAAQFSGDGLDGELLAVISDVASQLTRDQARAAVDHLRPEDVSIAPALRTAFTKIMGSPAVRQLAQDGDPRGGEDVERIVRAHVASLRGPPTEPRGTGDAGRPAHGREPPMPRPAGDQWPGPPGWPTLDEGALYGPLGRVVRTISPETEADPAAMLGNLLCLFGNAIGGGPHISAGGVAHPPLLFVVIVGETANARKGTAFAEIKRVMGVADPEWARRAVSGLSSGEGLVKHAAQCPAGRGLLVRESEFARVLKVAARDGSTLSPVLRAAWDSGELRVMTKDPTSASDAHVSVCGDITAEELHVHFGGLQAANGFGNRFLFVGARRTRSLPHGGKLDRATVGQLGQELESALKIARDIGAMRRSSAADRIWEDYYDRLGRDTPGGVLGGLISRGQAQLLRISEIYALADGKETIAPEHVSAAWAFWSYCRDSAEHLFGNRLGDPLAEKVLAILGKAPGGAMKRSEVNDALGGHKSSRELDLVERTLIDAGLVTATRLPSRGRWGELWVLKG